MKRREGLLPFCLFVRIRPKVIMVVLGKVASRRTVGTVLGIGGALAPLTILADTLIQFNQRDRLCPPHYYLRPPPLQCVEMGFYEDISWESRFNIEINV